MVSGREGVEGMRIEGVVGEGTIEAERSRCLAVAVRAARGGGWRKVLVEEGGVRIGWRKAVVGVGRERDVRELIRSLREGDR